MSELDQIRLEKIRLEKLMLQDKMSRSPETNPYRAQADLDKANERSWIHEIGSVASDALSGEYDTQIENFGRRAVGMKDKSFGAGRDFSEPLTEQENLALDPRPEQGPSSRYWKGIPTPNEEALEDKYPFVEAALFAVPSYKVGKTAFAAGKGITKAVGTGAGEFAEWELFPAKSIYKSGEKLTQAFGKEALESTLKGQLKNIEGAMTKAVTITPEKIKIGKATLDAIKAKKEVGKEMSMVEKNLLHSKKLIAYQNKKKAELLKEVTSARMKSTKLESVGKEKFLEAEKGVVKGAELEAKGKEAYRKLAEGKEGKAAVKVTKPALTAEEFLARGLGTKGKYIEPTDVQYVGAETLKKLDKQALESRGILSDAFEANTKLYGGVPGIGYAYEQLAKVGTKLVESRFARDLRMWTRSPELITRDPLYKEAFTFHNKQYMNKQRTMAQILHSYPGVKLNESQLTRVGSALENPKIVETLNKSEAAAYRWYKDFYKKSLELFKYTKSGGEDGYKLTNELILKYRGTKTGTEEIRKAYKLSNDQARAIEVGRREITDYLPHIYERPELIAKLEKDTLRMLDKGISMESKEYRQTAQLLENLKSDKVVSWDWLPEELKNKFFTRRYDVDVPYTKDADKTFRAYLKGWGREMYDDPAIKLWNENFMGKEIDGVKTYMDPAVEAYAKDFLRDYMGFKDRSSTITAIRSLEWMRTLGLNTSSAMVNNLQKFNTFYDAGPIAASKGWVHAWTPEGRRLFNKSGLDEEVFEVMFTGEKVPFVLEKLRRTMGVAFNAIERGNRRHAYSTYLLKGLKKFGNMEDAHWYAVSGVHKTQFQYGKMGMPKITRGAAGVATQFWSFPIKSVEFIEQMYQKNPLKAIGYVALAEGIRYTVDQHLNTDLSNQVGIGVTWEEVVKAARSASQGDIQAALSHGMIAIGRGSGVIPTGFGPAVNLAMAVGSFEPVSIKNELTPVAYKKLQQFVVAVKNAKNGKYPMYGDIGLFDWSKGTGLKYELSLQNLVEKTFMFKPSEASRIEDKLKGMRITSEMFIDNLREISNAIELHDTDKINKLTRKEHPVYSTKQSRKAARERHRKPALRRAQEREGKKRRRYREEILK